MRFAAWLVLLSTLLLWSGNWIVARAVRADVSPGIATVGRLVIVLVILAPFVLPGMLRKLPSLAARDWAILAALGLAGGGPHLALQWLGLHYTTATSGILYLSTTPIFILLAAPLFGERIRARRWLGVLVSFAGVVTIAAQGDAERLATLSFNRGDLMALASMVMWAGYTLLLRVRRDSLTTVELIVAVCVFGLLFMSPWLAFELTHGGVFRLTAAGIGGVAYSGICSLLLAYAGWSYVVTRLGAARAGVTLHLMPALGIVLSALFLAEYPHWYHFAGIGLILAGVTISSR